jgi:anti-sigma regulatory factor (Ser/Thr protein kinase)
MALYELRLAPQAAEIPRLTDWIAACCGAEEVEGDVAFKVTLAVEEAVINVIRHGFDGLPPPHLVLVRLDIAADSVVAEIVDNGPPFDPAALPDPDLSLPIERRNPGGLGVHLMRRMTDGLAYRRDSDCNILRLVKNRG